MPEFRILLSWNISKVLLCEGSEYAFPKYKTRSVSWKLEKLFRENIRSFFGSEIFRKNISNFLKEKFDGWGRQFH